MHELGIVFPIIDTVKEVAKKNGAKHVNFVTLEIGEVSSIVPAYLLDVWKWAVSKEPLLTGAILKIETVKAVTYCENCGHKYSTLEYAKICPKCGSDRTYLLAGNETNIKEIEVV